MDELIRLHRRHLTIKLYNYWKTQSSITPSRVPCRKNARSSSPLRERLCFVGTTSSVTWHPCEARATTTRRRGPTCPTLDRSTVSSQGRLRYWRLGTAGCSTRYRPWRRRRESRDTEILRIRSQEFQILKRVNGLGTRFGNWSQSFVTNIFH